MWMIAGFSATVVNRPATTDAAITHAAMRPVATSNCDHLFLVECGRLSWLYAYDSFLTHYHSFISRRNIARSPGVRTARRCR